MNNIPVTSWEITRAELTALRSEKDYKKSQFVEVPGQDFAFSFKMDISKEELGEKVLALTKKWGI